MPLGPSSPNILRNIRTNYSIFEVTFHGQFERAQKFTWDSKRLHNSFYPALLTGLEAIIDGPPCFR